MTRAWQASGHDPASAKFVECHATGTPLGDASEIAALALLVEHRPEQQSEFAPQAMPLPRQVGAVEQAASSLTAASKAIASATVMKGSSTSRPTTSAVYSG